MFRLNGIYRPITAQPFLNDETYAELRPCEELRPYIRCFWGTPGPCGGAAAPVPGSMLIIPDTCMDLIFYLDADKNSFRDLFAGISDTTFKDDTQAESTLSCFAVRFYCWAVPLFSGESMKGALNTFAGVEEYFKNLKRDFQDILVGNPLMSDRVAAAEQYLIKKLDLNRQNSNVMNAVYMVLKSRGTADISALAGYTSVSQRQLERLFLEHVGVSPKKLSGLVRYQYLWQDILSASRFDVLEGVCKYGYTDQAHLLNDFKKYHTLSPSDARKFASGRR